LYWYENSGNGGGGRISKPIPQRTSTEKDRIPHPITDEAKDRQQIEKRTEGSPVQIEQGVTKIVISIGQIALEQDAVIRVEIISTD
jgi:hypothetical protein